MQTLFLHDSRLTDHNKTRKFSTFFPTKFSTLAKISEISNFLSISNFFSVRFKTYWSLCKPKIFQKNTNKNSQHLAKISGILGFQIFVCPESPRTYVAIGSMVSFYSDRAETFFGYVSDL